MDKKIDYVTLTDALWNTVKKMKTAKQFRKWIDGWTAEVRKMERKAMRKKAQ